MGVKFGFLISTKIIHSGAKAVLKTWVFFSVCQEEAWGLRTLICNHVLGTDRLFYPCFS